MTPFNTRAHGAGVRFAEKFATMRLTSMSPKSHPFKPQAPRQLDDELRSIYAEGDGSMPDLTRLERRKGARFTRVLVKILSVLVLLSVASWAGFILWSRGWLQGNNDPLVITIEGPDRAHGGAETYYTVRYANHGHVPIASLSLKLSTPPSFHVLSLNPRPTDAVGGTWTLGSLNPDSDGAIMVSGAFRSPAAVAGTPAPDPQSIQASFTFKPANFNSNFQDIQTKNVDVDGTVLLTTVSGPTSVGAGDEADYVVNVQNTASVPTEHVRLTASPPAGYVVTDASPKPTVAGQWQWDFDALAAGAAQTVTLKGHYTAAVSGTQDMQVQTAFVDNSVTALQAQADANTEVKKGTVSLAMTVNGSVQDQGVASGAVLHLTASYGNVSAAAVTGAKISLTADTPDGKPLPFDWTKADIGKAARTGNVLTWDSKADAGLAKLAANASGSYDVTIPLASTIDLLKMSDRIVFTLSASYAQGGAHVIETAPLTVGVNSAFTAAAEGRYYAPDGKTVGSGPLPPKVGQKTGYRLVWTAGNGIHDLTGFSFTAHLPANVTWGGAQQPSLGAVNYDETARTITWAADTLPRNTSAATVSLNVSVTPAKSDVGKAMKLLDQTAVTATDSVTSQVLTHTLDPITTSLANDPGAKDKGIVAK